VQKVARLTISQSSPVIVTICKLANLGLVAEAVGSVVEAAEPAEAAEPVEHLEPVGHGCLRTPGTSPSRSRRLFHRIHDIGNQDLRWCCIEDVELEDSNPAISSSSPRVWQGHRLEIAMWSRGKELRKMSLSICPTSKQNKYLRLLG